MKILIFNWKDMKHPQAGGAELYLHEQAKLWVSKGHKVTWITSQPKGLEKEDFVDGIKIIRGGNKGTSFLWAVWNYFKKAKDCEVIIDSGNGFPFFTPLYSKKSKVLILYHYHNDVWFKEYKFPVAPVGKFLESIFTPIVYGKSRTITISESTKKDLENIMPNKKIDLVYCGVAKNLRPGKKSKSPEIIFLGRIKKYKSLDVLLKAIEILNNKFNGENKIKINIVGTGEDEERIKEMVKKMNLDNVRFHGFVPDGGKIKILQRSWIMINPSFIEGWSITNLEASACGVPVIGSNVRGVRESIIDGETGFLFKYGDYKELADKIGILLNDSKLRKKMEEKSVKRAKDFDWNKSARKLMKILEEVRGER